MPTLPDYRLTFAEPELEGIEVTMGRLTIDELFDYNDILMLPSNDKKDAVAYWAALRGFIAQHMIAWNVTNKQGKKLPPGDVADLTLLSAIRDGWLQGLNGGRAPLDRQTPRPAQEADLAALMQENDQSPAEPSDDGTEPGSSSAP